VPWYAKALALCVAGYALSPIDLIPDFIPIFGYLDDLIIVPLGIVAVVKLIPPEIMAEHRAAAAMASERTATDPKADRRTDDKNPRLHFQPSPPATRCICGGWFHVIGFS
jgi:uncharacterized membrane protein YkvA (DUF1232 family)